MLNSPPVEGDSSERLVGSAIRVFASNSSRPDKIVYDERTDWDDVNACLDYFHRAEPMNVIVDRELAQRSECLSFFDTNALIYFLPLFIANAALYPESDLSEVLVLQLKGQLQKAEFRGALSRNLADLVVEFFRWLPGVADYTTSEINGLVAMVPSV